MILLAITTTISPSLMTFVSASAATITFTIPVDSIKVEINAFNRYLHFSELQISGRDDETARAGAAGPQREALHGREQSQGPQRDLDRLRKKK